MINKTEVMFNLQKDWEIMTRSVDKTGHFESFLRDKIEISVSGSKPLSMYTLGIFHRHIEHVFLDAGITDFDINVRPGAFGKYILTVLLLERRS